MRDYKKLIAAGNKAQIEKLKENEHKKGFDDIDIMETLSLLYGEFKELEYECVYSENIDAIRLEAADIANFAHMIILKCDELLKENSRFVKFKGE